MRTGTFLKNSTLRAVASLIQETSGHVSAIEIRQPPVWHRRSLTGCALNDIRKGKANGSSTSNHLPSGRTAPIGEPVPAQITSPPTYFTWQPPVARGLVASTANVLLSVERLSPGGACKRHGCGCQCLPVDARENRPKLVAIAMKLIRCGSSCPAASVRPKQSATSVADLSSRNRGRRKRIRRSGTGGRKRRLQCRSRRRSLRSCG